MIGVGFALILATIQPTIPDWYRGKIVAIRPRFFGQKILALSFDDGPDPTNTPKILDALKKENAKATFFVLGSQAQKYPNLIKRIAKEGHAIGNHSFSHIAKTSVAGAVSELDKTNQAIGFVPDMFRPPYGIRNGEMAKLALSRKMAVILWTITAADTATRDSKVIANNIIFTPNPGDIALLHDGPGHLPTANAVPTILKELKAKGWKFVTLPTLLQAWRRFETKPKRIL